jgi:hypothetical protein
MNKNVEQETIKPIGQSTSIAIPKEELYEFNKVFWKKSVYDFHVNNKTVKNNFIIFEVRSLRVNEFLDILENNKISWSHINYKY